MIKNDASMTKPERHLNQDGFHLDLMAVGKVLMVVTSRIYLAQVEIFFQHYLVVLVSVTALIYKLKPQLDLRTLSMAPS